MSGIAIVFDRHGAEVEPALVDALAAGIAHRAIDGASCFRNGPLGMAHARFAVTREEVDEEQPLCGQARPVRMLFDGRLDNREEIIRALGLTLGEAFAVSDAGLAVRAYESWGRRGLERMIGPMAIAVHDAWRDRVLLFRDRTGGRGLYYHLDDRRLVASTEAQGVLAAGLDDALDEGRLASLFAVAEPAPGATFFQAVREVPAGHLLVVDGVSHRLDAWWCPGQARRLCLADDDAYAEQFLEHLSQAVACRTRAVGGSAAMMLSGGLDSAALAGAASGRCTPPPLAVSWGFERLSDADERAWSEPLTAALGLPRRAVLGDRSWPLSDPATWPCHPSTPEANGYRRLHEAVYGAVRETGRKVVLNGMFGDQLFLGCEGWWWSLVRDARLATAAGEARAGLRRLGATRFLRYALVGPTLRHLGLRRTAAVSPPWLTTDARRRLAPATARFAWTPRPIQAEAVLGPLAVQGVAHESWYAHRDGVEVRFPMRDARLVDFMLRLPAAQLHRASHRRPIVRRALKGRVPDRVRRRQDKTSLASLFRLGMTRETDFIDRLVTNPHAAWPSFVEPSWLLRKPIADAAAWSERRLFVLWLVVCVETWLSQRRRLGRMTHAPQLKVSA